MAKILICEDQPIQGRGLKKALSSLGHNPTWVMKPEEAFIEIRKYASYRMALLDMQNIKKSGDASGGDTYDYANKLKRLNRNLKVIGISVLDPSHYYEREVEDFDEIACKSELVDFLREDPYKDLRELLIRHGI